MNAASVGWKTQLVRYVAVGGASNAAAYLCYVALTSFGLWPECAMTIVYLTCALLGFVANRRLTFSHKGNVTNSGMRYVMAQAAGYGLNAFLLFVFANRFGYPHMWVQAAAIVVVAPLLFLAMKFFVFPRTSR